jgi:hypothetical protein
MTWHISIRHVMRALHLIGSASLMATILLVVGIIVLPPPTQSTCANVVAIALTSPDRPVAGSWACLASRQQRLASRSGFDGEVGLQRLAQSRGRDQMLLLGATSDGGYLYEFSGKTTSPLLVIVWMDTDGHVVRIDQDEAP